MHACPAASESPIRVLIIDQSDDDAVCMARLLRRAGIEPECVRVDTAEAIALALADARGWDVIVCDHRVPRLDAARVLHSVRTALPAVPILMVSGRFPFDLWHELGSGLVRKFLSKDRLVDLPETIRWALSACA